MTERENKVPETYNGMSAVDLGDVGWLKSRRSNSKIGRAHV